MPIPFRFKSTVVRTFLRSLAALMMVAGPGRAQTPDAAPGAKAAPMNGIAHVAIRVKSIPASVEFYHKLGFDQAFANMDKDGTTITQSFIKLNDRQYIELYPVAAQNAKEASPGFMHLCFEGADLNAIHDGYVAEGLTPTAVRTAGAGNLLFTLKGPQQATEPQNIEYTQYMPGSKHTMDVGKHLGPDRVGEKMIAVAVALQDASAGRDFYVTKLGFAADPTHPTRLGLPGASGEQVEIVPVDMLGARASILLESSNLDKAAAQLTRQQVEFKRASTGQTGADGKAHTIDMISVTDPDNNVIRIESVH